MRIPRASLPIGQQRCVQFDATTVLLCRTESGIFAIENVCSHSEFPLFGGSVADGVITCPVHGAKFDLKTGISITNKRLSPVRTYAVEVDGDFATLSLSASDS